MLFFGLVTSYAGEPGTVPEAAPPTPPAVSAETRAAYAEAVVQAQNAQRAYDSIFANLANLRAQIEESLKTQSQAIQAAQSVLAAAQVECSRGGGQYQLDAKTLQETGKLVCTQKPAAKPPVP